MSRIYDNWERLVRATLRREQLRLRGQRTPSDLSLASSSSFNFSASSRRLSSFNVPKVFDHEKVFRATNHLSKSNLIRHGHTGDLFRGVLDDGTQVVVKKIDLSSAEKKLDYVSELEAYAKASNSKLVPLLGHCLGNLDEHFLIYKYMPGRDLETALRREIVSTLDGPTRLKIATGVAEALYYLHHQCSPPLVHRDVQASSILVDNDLEVRLGSLSKICTQESESNGNSTFSQLPQGSKQDIFDTSNTTCEYDVYCFGKFLLELIRGKLGATATKDKEVSIDKSVDKIYRSEVAANAAPPRIIDPILLIEEPGWFPPGWYNFYRLSGAIVHWKMMVIAKNCLNRHPSRRPLMVHVLEALQKPWEEEANL